MPAATPRPAEDRCCDKLPQLMRRRRVLHTTCSVHGGCRGFTNLVVTTRDGTIVLDPHVTGQCVLILDQAAATELGEVLGEWLG